MDLRRLREKKTARFQDLDTWQAESRSRSGKLERMEASMSPSMEHSSSAFFLFLFSIKTFVNDFDNADTIGVGKVIYEAGDVWSSSSLYKDFLFYSGHTIR